MESTQMPAMQSSDFYCSYCKVGFLLEDELKSHCSTESHQLSITTDQDRKWHFRTPPRGAKREELSLCKQIENKGICRLADQCLSAHSEAELQEWKKRIAYREWKMEQAKQEDLNGSGYAEQLLERWMKACHPDQVMADEVEGFKVDVSPKLFVTFSVKNSSHSWSWIVSSKIPIRVVSLLYDTNRKYFKVMSIIQHKSEGGALEKLWEQETGCQEYHNHNHVMPAGSLQDKTIFCYMIKVQFKTDIFGTFRQTLVLDFGQEPVIAQKLCVDVVPPADLAQLQEIRETVFCATERWNTSNRQCILFENGDHMHTEHDLRLLKYYPIPHQGNFIMTQAVSSSIPVESTYKARFHELLYIEEIAQYNLISRYNVSSKLHMIDRYILTSGATSVVKYAHGGELFACMKLSSEVSEDSPAGRMIQASSSSVFIAPMVMDYKQDRSEKPKVYEARIEDKGKKMIYLRVPKQCVMEMNLKVEIEYSAEVQFQVNRLPFCEMHYAVDNLSATSLLFPDVTAHPKIPSSFSKPFDTDLDNCLNPKQKDAILAIAAPRDVLLPPILIIGPFGTGKTFTLAQAVKQILLEPDAKVLVCTHSNSAADIYIRDYLHPYVESGHTEATPLRIYYQHRWVATVNKTVLRYCLITEENARVSFRVPTVQDLQSFRVVVTTLSSSRYLLNLGLKKGFFTHILIDEAAQAMESEAIMPLALADLNTRIALAGDHMQLSPDVYSHFTQEKNLHMSLLERLFDLYPSDFPCKILLCENYRSHKAIVRYTSDMFYENSLFASIDQPVHKDFFPLTFFTARGEDIQDTNSTAYFNNSEVYEVAERVTEIHKTWPKSWGPFNDSSIGVVTPYYDQVIRIRTELRKRKLPSVSVERVLNVQGKQFRAIVLSTVRTLQTCRHGKNNDDDDLDFGFLSNARLLNTAITRGQSLVAVVGDPISLCSMGKCRRLWEKFIRTCYESGSLYGITWQSLQAHLDGLELKKTYLLNPLAPEFIPRRLRMGMPAFPMADKGLVGNVPCFGSNVLPPWNPMPLFHDGNAPFYPMGPFFDPLPNPYMGLQLLPPVPYSYNNPSYGYPWYFASKGGAGSSGNAGLQPVLNKEPVSRNTAEGENCQPFIPPFHSEPANRHRPFQPPMTENSLIYDEIINHSRMNKQFPERSGLLRNRLETLDNTNFYPRVIRNQNLDATRIMSSNMVDSYSRRNSSEHLTNQVPCAVQPYSFISELDKQHVNYLNFKKSNALNQLKNQEDHGRTFYADSNIRENLITQNIKSFQNNDTMLNCVEQSHPHRLPARYDVDNISSILQQRFPLPVNHAYTVDQIENGLWPGNAMPKVPVHDQMKKNMKFREEKLPESRYSTIPDEIAQLTLDATPVNGIRRVGGYQLVNHQEGHPDTAHKKPTFDDESATLEKLLRVSQRVWSEQPPASLYTPHSSSLLKAPHTSKNELYVRRPFSHTTPCLLPSSETDRSNFPETFASGNSRHRKVSVDYLGSVHSNGYVPGTGSEGGYNVFQHKTILR